MAQKFKNQNAAEIQSCHLIEHKSRKLLQFYYHNITIIPDIPPVSTKKLLDIQAITEYRFILNAYETYVLHYTFTIIQFSFELITASFLIPGLGEVCF